MDFWVVAAVASGGYFSKYWKNHDSGHKDSFPVCSSDGLEYKKPEATPCPFRRMTQQRKVKDISPDEKWVYGERQDTYEFDYSNFLPLSNLGMRSLTSECLTENEYEFGAADHFDSSFGTPRNGRVSNVPGSRRTNSSLRYRHLNGHSNKPLSPLESCAMAQLYTEHARMEEYVLRFASPSPLTIRPFVVTDGSNIISKPNGNFLYGSNGKQNKLHKEANVGENNCIYGIPPLPKISSTDLCKETRLKRGKVRRRNDSCKVVTQKHFNSQGFPDETVLFRVGIWIGIICSFITNKKEIDKLSSLLKQTESLVQDLQEELEMKDSIMVKDLTDEDHEPKALCNDLSLDKVSNPFSPKRTADNSEKYNDKESYYEKAGQNPESMSKIEAELEAELERLGLNMNVSDMDMRVSDLIELDPDFVADFAQGELKADMLNARTASDPNSSGAFTTHSGNYAVSHRELSLRLHEVIESRLAERVRELETALENSNRKMKLLESSHKSSQRRSPNNEPVYAVDEKRLAFDEDSSLADHPLVLNLSGEALDAYNEAYEEVMKIESDEEDSSRSRQYSSTSQQGLDLFEGSISPRQDDDFSVPQLHFGQEMWRMSDERFASLTDAPEGQLSRYRELFDIGVSEEESSGTEDEMEKQLIKQIVERTKRGSPAVLNAQKIFSMEQN